MPASLVAVVAGAIIVIGFKLPVNTIGMKADGSVNYTITKALPHFVAPDFSYSMVKKMLPSAFTIAILAGIESLLSAVVADSMINSRHLSNMELVAQGIGNIGSALFGGIPATGAIARTAANIKNGGRTPIAGIVHAVVLLAILVILMPYAGLIPMPCIAAILFQVAYNMCQWRPFVRLVKNAPKSDIIVLVLSFVLTVVFDLVMAIEWGMIVACILFIKRMREETHIQGWTYQKDDEEFVDDLRPVAKEVRVFEITGPLFFGVSDMLADDINVKSFTKVLVIRMRAVPAIDATALKSLEELVARAKKKEITVIFSHVNEQPLKMMEKASFIELVGQENFQPNIDAALDRAETLIK